MVFAVTLKRCAQFVKVGSKISKIFKSDINFWSYSREYIKVLISIKSPHVNIHKHQRKLSRLNNCNVVMPYIFSTENLVHAEAVSI